MREAMKQLWQRREPKWIVLIEVPAIALILIVWAFRPSSLHVADVAFLVVCLLLQIGIAFLGLIPVYVKEAAIYKEALHDAQGSLAEIAQSLQDVMEPKAGVDEGFKSLQRQVEEITTTVTGVQAFLRDKIAEMEEEEARASKVAIGVRRGRPKGSTRWSRERISQEMKNLEYYLDHGGTITEFASAHDIPERTLREYRKRWLEEQEEVA